MTRLIRLCWPTSCSDFHFTLFSHGIVHFKENWVLTLLHSEQPKTLWSFGHSECNRIKHSNDLHIVILYIFTQFRGLYTNWKLYFICWKVKWLKNVQVCFSFGVCLFVNNEWYTKECLETQGLVSESSYDTLTGEVPITTPADDSFEYFFHCLLEKISLDVSCESSARQRIHTKHQTWLRPDISCGSSCRQRIHMKHQSLFSLKVVTNLDLSSLMHEFQNNLAQLFSVISSSAVWNIF